MAISAVHTLIYSDDAPATRAFLKDVLQWPFVSDEEGPGDPADWLIFATGPSELGVHPTAGDHGGETWSTPRHHEIALMCDDLDATVADLRSRGAEFAGEPRDLGFRRGILVHVPGADDILLYEPRHAVAHSMSR